MRIEPWLFRRALATAACTVALSLPAGAATKGSIDQVIDAVIANERALAKTIAEYQPLVETYLQTVRPDPTLGTAPVNDNYFVGRFQLPREAVAGDEATSQHKQKDSKKKTLDLFQDFHSSRFKPEQFARMLIVDQGGLDRGNYAFDFLRSEFLGEVRTLVFDVSPKAGAALNKKNTARFSGRIWVEDRDYHIVRFNGVYASVLAANFHFDSWRLYGTTPAAWLPAYVYIEESERASKQLKLVHKGQIRIWGYSIDQGAGDEEFTQVKIEAPRTHDANDSPGQISPVESARAWESEAEDNLVRRLERAGLLAPAGEVDKVLETVVHNLEITNALNIEPQVRCRVLMTTPLESFTIGHTIVLSRGLVDVLPDEASLGMVLAHELGHVVSGHELDTSYAFSDRMLVNDRQALEQFVFLRDPLEETEADNKAFDLLQKSPYKDTLQSAGLFLKALVSDAKALPALIRPHFGNRIANQNEMYRMLRVMLSAPVLDPTSVTQIAALPLGGRVKVDPWSGRIELMKNNRVALQSAREKLPFQITPMMPYLARGSERTEPKSHEASRERMLRSKDNSRGAAGESDDEAPAVAETPAGGSQ